MGKQKYLLSEIEHTIIREYRKTNIGKKQCILDILHIDINLFKENGKSKIVHFEQE